MIYVICSNSEQFGAFCIDANIPRNNSNFKPVQRADQLRGTLHVPVILYGQHWLHPEWEYIQKMLPTRNPVFLTLNEGN